MKNVILGTDWWDDCDDVVAVRLLTNLHKQHEVNLLGVIINACMEYSVSSLGAFLNSCDVEVPIGIDLEATDFGGTTVYQKPLAGLPSRYKGNIDAEDPVKLYRRLLADSDTKVDIMEIGYPQVLAALLNSPEDEYSQLTGMELVAQKVGHLWMMAGKWGEVDGGVENNFARNRRASIAAAQLCEQWPTAMTFLGWEVGATVITGTQLPQDDLLKEVMVNHGSGEGRSSWDPMLILLAAAVKPEQAGYECVYGQARVTPEEGRNFFTPSATGRHRYVVKQRPDQWYAAEIDRRL